jgi:PAS domain S-box-containing protein
MNPLLNLSLKTRVTFLTLAIFLAGISMMAWYMSQTLHEDLDRQVSDQQFSSASLLAGQVNHELSDRMDALEVVAGEISPAMLAKTATVQSHLASRPVLQILFNAGTFITRTDGTPIADVPVTAGRLGRNVLDRDYMVAALKEGKSSVGRPVLGKALGTPVFSMATPIRDAQGNVIGALVGVVNLGIPNFLDTIAANTYGKTGGYLLVERRHRLIITATDKTRVMETLPVPGIIPLIDRFINGEEGSGAVVNPLGVEVLASGKGIPIAGWSVVVLLPTAEAFAPVHDLLNHLLLATLVFALLAGGLIWWVLYRQLAPVFSTAKILALMAEPNRPLQALPITRQDEIGGMIGGFNRLIATLGKHEEDLIRDQQRLSSILWGTRAGTWEWNVQTGETRFNERWAEMVGYRLEELAPVSIDTWVKLDHPDDLKLSGELLEKHFAGEIDYYECESRMRHKDGHWVWVLDRGKLVSRTADDQPEWMVGTHEEITERKQAEKNLQAQADALALANAELDQHQHHLEELVEARTKELENARVEADSANRSKSEFLATMSHEIRTPMNGVVGMVDILQATELNPAQQRMLDTVHNSSLALLSILNDILDFSKIEAGKLDVESIPTHLREVVEGVAQLMLNVAGSREVQISLFVDPALPVWIFSDPTRLRQVLFNLLSNALKFVSQGKGRAMLHVHPVVRPDGVACVQLSVIDNGIGMSAAVVGRLFKPFSQADASTARKFGGTGLGLSITKRLVEMMHGRISVISTPGVGSEFTIEFPLQAAPVPAGRTLNTLPDLKGVRVLAVTPVAACSTLFQIYLGEAGANVTVVPDLATARQRLAQWPGDTVLLLDLDDEGVGPIGQAQDSQWPTGVHVVRLVTRSTCQDEASDAPAHETRILARPLLHHDLIRGVAVASGRLRAADSGDSVERRFTPRFKAPSVEEAAQSGQLVLIAEDNETNRDVMQAQLRLLGYASEVAEDGLVALNMWHSGRYSLLLTDCNMPNMDGFDLTSSIRQIEVARAAGRRLPIVAVTANAMQGEAMRCRERGMDDYLSKPLRLNELGPMLAKWLSLPTEDIDDASDATPDAASAAVPSAPTFVSIIWDDTVLTRMVGDNPVMHRRVLEKFLISTAEQITHVVAAAASEDTATAGNAAHALKSAARTVGALQLGELCEALETAGKAGDATLCSELIKQVPTTFTLASQSINKHLESLS